MLVTANRETYVRWQGPKRVLVPGEEGMPTHWKTANESFEVCIASKGKEVEK
jgi:hypothetical protein